MFIIILKFIRKVCELNIMLLSNLSALSQFIMLLTLILFHCLWFLVICILNLLMYYNKINKIIFFYKTKGERFVGEKKLKNCKKMKQKGRASFSKKL